jgi:hypothetical protein
MNRARNPRVHHRQVRLVSLNLLQQVLAFAGLAHHDEAGLLQQPHDPLPQQERVLRHDYSHWRLPA